MPARIGVATSALVVGHGSVDAVFLVEPGSYSLQQPDHRSRLRRGQPIELTELVVQAAVWVREHPVVDLSPDRVHEAGTASPCEAPVELTQRVHELMPVLATTERTPNVGCEAGVVVVVRSLLLQNAVSDDVGYDSERGALRNQHAVVAKRSDDAR